MIHVLDYKGNIIDFISQDDNAIIKATHHRDINERTETFDFTILSERAENMQDRNRIIIQDSNEQYREFIIEHVSQDMDGYTEIETSASYLEDISTSVPYPPGKLTSMTTSQALRDVLKDTGWQVSDRTEYGGIRSTSWTSFQTRYEVLMQLCTTYSMIPDFYIEIGTNKVEGRYVVLKKRNAIFNGKEIVYGKDLLEMKRTVDMTEIKTALLASGPQKEDGTPGITLTVKDDEANNRYSLPGRYLWGIYSPESSDENMTESRLRTLATTELNKRKAAAISYEVKATDIKRYYPHEVIRLGDKIRIKNEDFVPSLYLEAEVIGEDYDLISGDSEYSFGEYKEYAESELNKTFAQRLRDIQQKLNDKVSNINTIIQQTQAGNLEYFEKKIIKSSTPPPNPVNDTLWYDTSNPSVAVVRRYWNGEWLESTVEDVEQIGGITREKALFSELENTFVNLSIQHSRLLSDVYGVINSEYFVDSELKSQVQNDLDNTVSIFNQIKNNLDSMTPETATIGKLVDTQALFLQYRESMQTLYRSVETAKLSIDERFKLLQSQYTDEKFNYAMEQIAATLPNGEWDSENNQLLGEIPSRSELAQMQNTIIQYMTREIGSLNEAIGEETDYKINAAKNEISASINSVKKEIDGIDINVAKQIEPIKTRVTTTESNIKVLQDGLKLTATKTEVEQTINDKLTPIQNQVNEQKATLDVLPEQIASKVSQSDYTTDRNNIVSRLNSADTERVQLANQISDRVTLKEYTDGKAQTDQTLTTMQTQINQNGTDINLRATKDEFNQTRKTLSSVISDLTVNTTTGLTLSYDENGNIQSHTVGPDGVKIKGDRVNITVNEEFKVMTAAVNNKVGKNEVVNSINVSNEGTAIDANKVGIRGGDGTTYLDIQNTKILSRGFFDRTWGDVTDRPYCKLGIYDGHLIMQNETSGKNLYLTEKGLSTTMAGNLKGTSGTLEFHFFNPEDNTEGVRLHSYYGVVYLQSQENRVYIRSKQTTNIETVDAGVYLRPYILTRPGVNEFSYKVMEADNAADTDGYFVYGEVANPSGLAGSGIRFRKKGLKGEVTGDYEPMIYATDNAGNANTGSFSARNFYGDLKTRLKHLYIMADSNGGEIRATSTTGYNSGNTTYLPVRAAGIKTHSALAFTNHANSDVFFGIMPNKTFCFTDVNGYNGGKPAYQSIRAKEYLPGSLEEYKRDIKEWNDDALSTISNAQLYQYNYKNDLDDEKTRHGFVIGEDYSTPDDFIDGDGVKTYEMIAYCMRAIQQLNEKLEEYKNGK